MANIERIVNATILLRSAPVAEKTFSDMIVIGTHNFTVSRVSSVSSADELLDKGVSELDPLYRAVKTAFSQEPGVDTVYIGRRVPTSAAITIATPFGDAGEVYSVTIEYMEGTQQGSAVFTYTTVGDSTDDTSTKIAALLAAIINPNTALTATATLDSIALVTAAGTPAVTTVTSNITPVFTPATETITVAAAAAKRENDVFYGVTTTSRVLAEQLQLADWIEANDKLGGFATGDVNSYVGGSTTDLLARMNAKNYFRSFGIYTQATLTEGEYPEIALMSRKFREQPGSETWANATLGGVSDSNLSESEFKAIVAKNGNTFEPFRNLALSQNGKVAGGEWIDVIRFRDWQLEQVRVNGFAAFVNNRIGFTDPGIAILHNRLLQSLNKGVDVGGIAPKEVDPVTQRLIPSYTTVYPSASSITANDKALRVLKGLKFTARLTGAIHAVEINGTLAYEL